MLNKFPLYQSHIDLAQQYWQSLIEPQDIVIDATCGNGKDTLILSKSGAVVYAIDIQEEALQNTKKLTEGFPNIFFIQGCHSKFPEFISKNSVKLIVYNLGYLPGGDKTKTTITEKTLLSLQNGLELIQPGGAISLTCYPGHAEGLREQNAIAPFLASLSPYEWSCCSYQFLNRKSCPNFILIQKKI